jgi:ornithine cyclodeaminase
MTPRVRRPYKALTISIKDNQILLLSVNDVRAMLDGREAEVMRAVADAYVTHWRGHSSLPHSVFLRFAHRPADRVIALPAYLGGEFDSIGMKWVSSFPGNHEAGLDRASAVVILNSAQTGRPMAILEGSVISARRTAASAALAAQRIHGEGYDGPVGLIGCGPINLEIVRFLRSVYPAVKEFVLFDLQVDRARAFAEELATKFPGASSRLAVSCDEVLRMAPLVSFATTAARPHVSDLSACARGTTILHVSLRDLSAEAILSADNVVDDVDHVCRAETSIHLAEQLAGTRAFIRCTLAQVLCGESEPRVSTGNREVTVFSPFGLGVLDLAVAGLVVELARERGAGELIQGFLPA